MDREWNNRFLLLFSNEYRRLFLQSLVLSVFDTSAYWFTYSWLPGYLHEERHFPMIKSAIWMLVTQAGGLLGYLSFGFAADKFGRRPAYSVYSFIMAASLIMITLLWNVVVYPAVLLSFMFFVGFGTGMFSELYPTGIRNTAMGSAFNLARGVQFFTLVIIAVVAERYGLGGGISLAAVFAVLTGIWIWTFPETKGLKLKIVERH